MINNFLTFYSWILDTLAAFLMSEPIIWIVGLILFLIVFKVFLSLLNINRYY